ncbi:unnamed protein product, partial [Rotaria sp. Silwood1]
HVEFEINPLDKSSDYCVKVVLQSFEIKYNASTINKLAKYIDIDLQSSYFLLLDDNGVYQDDAAVICMDFGHLALKRTRKP